MEARERLPERTGEGRDLYDLADLDFSYGRCYTFRIDYRQPAAIWTARPHDGGKAVTADSAAELRAKLRQAHPADRDGSRD